MTVNSRKILVLPFALADDDLRAESDYLGRQLPILIRNCFERNEANRVVASPIATERDGQRYWVVHNDLWRDESARNFARSRGYDIVVFGILSGPAADGSIRTLKLRSVMVESGKLIIDKTITGDVFRLARTSLEALSVYASMIPRDAAELFRPGTRSSEAFEKYLRGLDVLLALRSDGITLNDDERALQPFGDALDLDPEFTDALTAGLSCALQALEPAGGDIPTDTVHDTLDEWRKLQPEDERIPAVLAEILIARGDRPRALAVLQRALETIRPLSRDLLRRSGDTLHELGRTEDALAAYEACEAIAHDPVLVERMSGLNILVGRSEIARRQLDELLVENPERVDLICRAALLAHRDGSADAAWRRFSEMFVAGRAPGESELGKLNVVVAKSTPPASFVEALRTWYPPEGFTGRLRLLFAKTLRLAGASVEAGICLSSVDESTLEADDRSLLARERLNLIHEEFDTSFAALAERIVNEDTVEGHELLDDAVDREPDFWPARFLRGLVLSKRGEFEAAIDELDRVLATQPGNDVVWYTRGVQLVRLGKDEEAIACFESAIRLNDGETDYHSNLALSHARLQHPARALAALGEVERLRPSHPDNERLRRAVEETLDPA